MDKLKTIIYTFPIDNERNITEIFNGKEINSIKSFLKELKKVVKGEINIYTIENFVEMINDEYFNEMENWIGYVTLK